MKNIFLILFCVLSFSVQAQKTISGTFSPAEDYSWLIAYRLKPGTQAYVADTSIKDGKFNLQIPKTAEKGTYRLVYAVPQDEFYFDVIFNGKEDIELNFETEEGARFTASQENILFSTYFREIQEMEGRLRAFYSGGSSDKEAFLKIVQNYMAIQHSYMERSENLMVQEFIKANRPYIPPRYEPLEEYVKNRKKYYFDAIDMSNAVLQGSDFLTDKIANYAFTALPLKTLSDSETEDAIQQNIRTVSKVIQDLSKDYQFHLFHSLWEYASDLQLSYTSDFIFKDFLQSTALSEENKEILNQIEAYNRLRIGQIPPEIEWQSKGNLKKLSSLQGASNYILVFWSSTCSHCLNELPALHKELKKRPGVKVIAIGLEDDEVNWKLESEKLDSFEHAIALGKWESAYAQLYDIHQTPTYFILDDQKRIIAKPESDRAVVEFLER